MRFIYIGGTEFDGTPLPAEVIVHGVSFLRGAVTELPASACRTPDIHAHVCRKLSNHPHFQLVPEPMEAVASLSEDEATQLVENVFDAPVPKKRGRPRKVVHDDIADAAE